MGSPLTRREGLAVCALVLLGLALRVVFVLDMEAHPAHQVPILDSAFHVDWARAMAAGEEYAPLAGRPFFRAPLYVWFLSGLFFLFGDGLLLPRLVQCLLGAASVALVHLVGRRAFGPRSALLAAAIAATYWLLIYFDAELLSESLVVPLVLISLWLTLGLADAPTRGRAVVAGLAWGVTALARPNVLLFLPLVPLWLLWRRRPRPLRGLAAAALFGVGVLAPILPVTAWNTFVQGDFALIGSYGGINLWIGNNPSSNGVDAFVPGSRGGWWEGYYDAIALAERAEGRSLRASEVSRHYAHRAWDFILGQPGQSIPHFGRKFLLFWAGEYGNNEPEVFVANRFSAVPRLSMGYGLLAPLALVGMAVAWRRAGRLLPLYGFFAAYLMSLVLFFVASRYRVPVLPVMMVFAGHALVWLWTQLRAGERLRPAMAAAFVLAFAGWASTQGPAPEVLEANGHLLLAGIAEERGDPARAAAHLRHTLALQPNRVNALASLAFAERSQGHVEVAITLYRRALHLRPLDPYALEGLLDLTIAEGRTQQAERWLTAYLERLAKLGVEQPPEAASYHLGRLLAGRGERDEARAAFARALHRDPHSARAALALGDLESEAQRWPEAARAYEQALFALAPRVPSAHDDRAYAGLVRALAASGREEAACRRAAAWQARRPGSEAARAERGRRCG